MPVTNNAVAVVETADGAAVFSFLGLDATKEWSGVASHAFRWNLGDSTWIEISSVPGPGRLAATAQVLRGKVYIFGGYTVDEDGSERSLPNVDIYDPIGNSWTAGVPMPIAVDDAVSGVWRDSLIYLVSGWDNRDNVSDVQVYDPAADAWRLGTRIVGPPVFGHAGAIAENTIVYVDGVKTSQTRPRFTMERSVWRGEIDPEHPSEIDWRKMPDHPGAPLYRAAAVGVGHWVIITGGTDNPYNYNGIGYNGIPSEPRSSVFAFDTRSGEWRSLAPLGEPSMDHRGIAVAGDRLVIIGGMGRGQRVSSSVWWAEVNRLINFR